MHDPVYKAVVCARIGLLFSEPSLSEAFGPWAMAEDKTLQSGVEIVDAVVHYHRERVKAMTTEELRQALASAARLALRLDDRGIGAEHHAFDFAI
jgi:hypothetical protein